MTTYAGRPPRGALAPILARHINDLLKSKGITTEQLRHLLPPSSNGESYHRSTVARLRTGKAYWDLEQLDAIARALDMSTLDLLNEVLAREFGRGGTNQRGVG